MRISRLGEGEGFVTGYYEPIIDGSRTQNEVYNVPVYRRPSNLFVRGTTQSSAGLPNKGQVFRKIGRRKLVPYYDRAEIEDGAIEGRGLEICWLKNQTDLLFAQIQGSARVSLDDGSTVRINYDAHNGYPYTPVGRILIERNIIPRDQMSMQKIREWMEQNPDGANELRRQNRSYVFFREVKLSDKDEAVGAQGVPLTPGRSIAVDKSLHVYGTPFFIEGELPIESERSKTPFRRLMIAQDTGSAIVGPARADLYFGAGPRPARWPAGCGTMRALSCWCRRASIRRRAAARCRCRTRGRRRKSQNCFRKPIRRRISQRTTAAARGTAARHAHGGSAAASSRAFANRAIQAAVAKPVPLPEARPKIAAGRQAAPASPAAIAIVDETPAAELDPGIAGAAAAQAQPERGRARAVGERRQAGQAAAQAARVVEAAGSRRTRIRNAAPKPAARRRHAAPPRIAAAPKPQPPPLAPIGRRERSQLSRGRKEIDARIDLHGMTQIRAHRALFGFLQRAHHDGLTFVLVITGKGKIGAGSERGVLRRQVPQWLGLPEFRTLVVGFEEAHIGHGGEGALYVRVRRAQTLERPHDPDARDQRDDPAEDRGLRIVRRYRRRVARTPAASSPRAGSGTCTPPSSKPSANNRTRSRT